MIRQLKDDSRIFVRQPHNVMRVSKSQFDFCMSHIFAYNNQNNFNRNIHQNAVKSLICRFNALKLSIAYLLNIMASNRPSETLSAAYLRNRLLFLFALGSAVLSFCRLAALICASQTFSVARTLMLLNQLDSQRTSQSRERCLSAMWC